MDTIPIVDLMPISAESASLSDWNSVAKAVGDALHQVGFVYLLNHGIHEKKVADAFLESRKFFELSQDVKRKYTKNPEVSHSGYSEPGQEILDVGISTELRESFDLNLKETKSHPVNEVPNFESALLTLKAALKPLVFKLLKIFAKALQLDNESYFIEASKHLSDPSVRAYTTLRSLYYPAISEKLEIKPGTVRCAPHSDYGTFTLLFQDDKGGLETKMVGDKWAPANPIPGSILINAGDLLEFWSGGYFPATVHRILIPESEIKKRTARQSIAYFVHPDDEMIITPLKKSGTQFQPVTAYEHAKMKLERSYRY